MWTGNLYDMNIWFQTGIWMNQGTNIYLPDNHLGYPPLWAFWCLIAYRLYSALGNNVELWRFVIKLPLILAQFGLAFAMARFAQSRFGKTIARKIFLLVLTWIFFIYIGALWGQLNMLSALLTFLAFYAVISKRNTLGAVLLGLAMALKIYPLILLPAFVAFIIKNQTKKEAGRFALFSVALPVVFTLGVLAVYQWDTIYFLRTIFYWTPVFETTNPLQIQGGCMNIWSFISLLNVDVAQVWLIRFIWIPVLGATAIYWFKKPQMKDVDLNLAIISLFKFLNTTEIIMKQEGIEMDYHPPAKIRLDEIMKIMGKSEDPNINFVLDCLDFPLNLAPEYNTFLKEEHNGNNDEIDALISQYSGRKI